MTSKRYLKTLMGIFTFIVISVCLYIGYYIKHYPLSLTNNIYFDAKLKFIRDTIDVDKVDTLILGSSVGLNNIQGSYLQKESQLSHYVLNLSVNGAYTLRSLQLLELIDAFPNLKRVIYSTQYTDLGVTHTYQNYDAALLIKYMRHELSLVELWLVWFRGCNNLSFCIQRQKNWEKEHACTNKFTSLVFESTGSVPLYIYGKDINPGRWHGAQPGYMPQISYDAIESMVQKVRSKNIKFYLVQQAYRQAIIHRDKRVKDSMQSFKQKMQSIMHQNDGVYINLHERLRLDDRYFADRNHLNDKGSILAAKEIARFIDSYENNL